MKSFTPNTGASQGELLAWIYKGYSEINVSYVITLGHDVRGKC